ncbi:MAG: transglutaminase domain-containing protein [Lachnospiraceae bacterium]|nr:transglutaminase domain-containing protein [Lachnospiraceae bacterium]
MKKRIAALLAAGLLLAGLPMSVQAAPEKVEEGWFFDAEYYAESNPDVKAAFGNDKALLYRHYRDYGIKEGRYPYRPGSAMASFENGFDAAVYAAHNPDVVQALGSSPTVLYKHFHDHGSKEDRVYSDETVIPATITRSTYPQAAEALDMAGWDLRSAFNWSVHNLTYYGHGKPDMPENGSPGTRWFAEFGFTNHKGNCYVFAATFCEMARLLGYDATQMSGYVPRTNGTQGPHSWDEIVIDGTSWVFDPECSYASRIDAYQIWYGKPGTWRYVNYTPMTD